jgi:hypothetical protein
MNVFRMKVARLKSIALSLIQHADLGVWWANHPYATCKIKNPKDPDEFDSGPWSDVHEDKLGRAVMPFSTFLVGKNVRFSAAIAVSFAREIKAVKLPAPRDEQPPLPPKGSLMAYSDEGPFVRFLKDSDDRLLAGDTVTMFWRSVFDTISCHLDRRPVPQETVDVLRNELFEPTRIAAKPDERGGLIPETLEMEGTIERTARWHLFLYLRSFASDERLWNYDPLGICPECRRLFLKNKFSQSFCSNKCYQKHWTEEKVKADPRYFADKAAQSRKARKAMGVRRRISRKSLGELSAKQSKTQRKRAKLREH